MAYLASKQTVPWALVTVLVLLKALEWLWGCLHREGPWRVTNNHLWDLLLGGISLLLHREQVPDGIVLPLLIPGCKSLL